MGALNSGWEWGRSIENMKSGWKRAWKSRESQSMERDHHKQRDWRVLLPWSVLLPSPRRLEEREERQPEARCACYDITRAVNPFAAYLHPAQGQ